MIVVVGLAFEARIAAGAGVKVICGGDGRNLAASLKQGVAAGCSGLISFGVAGGLAPDLRPGTCVIGSAVIAEAGRLPTDRDWSHRLLANMPGSVHGALLGAANPVKTATAKRALHLQTGAVAVDTESHVVAQTAADHGLPMVAIRVIIDSAGHSVPEAALGAVRADGTTDVGALLRGLMRRPQEIAPLLRIALAAQSARATLRRGCQLLGPSHGVPSPQPFHGAVPQPAVGPLEAAPPALGSSFG
jgi:hopanoid-associated phosphorylase